MIVRPMQDDHTGTIPVLNPPVATYADAHGLTCETVLDGRRMRVMLPEAPLPREERQPPGSIGDLRTPTGMDHRLRDFMAPKLPWFTPWGYVARIDTGAGWVHRIVVELDGLMPRIAASRALEAWGGRMLLWLEVWTRQNLSRPSREGGPMSAMGVAHMQGDDVLRPKAMLAEAFIEPLHHLDLAASRADWEKAIKLAAQEVEPPLEHRLLRDAQVQLGRGEQRLAVITAGTAVEVAVGTHLLSLGVNLGPDPGLGHVLGVARDQRRLVPLGLDYYRDVDPTLVSPRNGATHRAYDPTTAETEAALDLATTLVRHFAPLESYRARP